MLFLVHCRIKGCALNPIKKREGTEIRNYSKACYKVQRFGELIRRLDGITQSTLTKQLRELEADGFLHREIYKEIPPKVEYTLSELGESFIPVLNAMMAWSETHLCPGYVNTYTNQEDVDKEK